MVVCSRWDLFHAGVALFREHLKGTQLGFGLMSEAVTNVEGKRFEKQHNFKR
jgi:hypothetical protein